MTIRHFSDYTGEAAELASIQPLSNEKFAAQFPGVRGRRWDGFSKMVGCVAGSKTLLPVTRSIDYKRNPSLHVCNAKCVGGKVNGRCECSCRGKNHGAGMFTSLMTAA